MVDSRSEIEDHFIVKKGFSIAAVALIIFIVSIVLLTVSDQLRIFWYHARTDDEEAQIGLDHFVHEDYVRGIPMKPMAPSNVYFGQFGGPYTDRRYILLDLPKECASARYILNNQRVLVPDGPIWTAGQLAFWWKPNRVHDLPYSRPEDKPSFGGDTTYDAYFKSPSCGPIRFHLP